MPRCDQGKSLRAPSPRASAAAPGRFFLAAPGGRQSEDLGSIQISIQHNTKLVGGSRASTYTIDSSYSSAYGTYRTSYVRSPVSRQGPEVTSRSVPRKSGFSGQRTLLYEDDRGVKLHFVETLATAHGHVRLVVTRRR